VKSVSLSSHVESSNLPVSVVIVDVVSTESSGASVLRRGARPSACSPDYHLDLLQHEHHVPAG
jgi:hypothetical protein